MPSATAVNSSGAPTCTTRSRVASECRAHRIIAIVPNRYGIAVTKPVCALEKPNALTICGSQNCMP